MTLKSAILTGVFGVLCLAGQAQASVIATYTTALPSDHYTAPDSTYRTVVTKAVGTTRMYKSPFGDSISPYVAVEVGYAAYLSKTLADEVSLVWGSPDKFNKVLFFLGKTVVDSITGSAIGGGTGRGSYFATLRTSEQFDKVEFVSTSASFEFSNVMISAVPLPAAAPLFGAALLGLGVFGYGARRRKAAAIA